MKENEIQKTEATAIQPIDPASPAGLMSQLMSKDGPFDVEGFGKMLEFQAQHEDRQAKKAYHVAMAEFQAEVPKIIKQKSGHNNKYAGLSDIVAVIAPLESKHGLSHSWVTGTANKEIKVICKITHILGHSEETELSAGPDKSGSKNDIQALGSTITYLQRYTLKAALGLAEADQDDDGNGSGKKPLTVRPPTDEEWGYIDDVCNAMTCPEGMRADRKKVAAICYELKQSYPHHENATIPVAKWLSEMDRHELFMPENRSDFEIGQKMPGDEDSVPDEPPEPDEPETPYQCPKCGLEFPTPREAAECIC